MATHVLLFDLGGVVIDWGGPRELARLTGADDETVRRRFAESETVRLFETGGCGSDAFARAFVEEWGLSLDEAGFLDLFASWLGRPYDGILDAFKKLKPHYRLACLSNSNPVHWQLLLDEIGIERRLQDCFASHLLQVAKPDPRAFQLVLDRLGVAPSQVTYFDDGARNVEAAAALGIDSHLVDPDVGVLPTLQRLGMLKTRA